jgi:hypothetical protein
LHGPKSLKLVTRGIIFISRFAPESSNSSNPPSGSSWPITEPRKNYGRRVWSITLSSGTVGRVLKTFLVNFVVCLKIDVARDQPEVFFIPEARLQVQVFGSHTLRDQKDAYRETSSTFRKVSDRQTVSFTQHGP